MCVHLCVFVWIHSVCRCAFPYVHIQEPELMSSVSPITPHHNFWLRSSHATWSSLRWLGWLVRGPAAACLLLIPNARSADVRWNPFQFFTFCLFVFWRSEFRFSCLHSQRFTHGALLQVPKLISQCQRVYLVVSTVNIIAPLATTPTTGAGGRKEGWAHASCNVPL